MALTHGTVKLVAKKILKKKTLKNKAGQEMKFSAGWFSSFTKRQNMTIRTRTNSSKLSYNEQREAMNRFHIGVRKMLKEGPGYEWDGSKYGRFPPEQEVQHG